MADLKFCASMLGNGSPVYVMRKTKPSNRFVASDGAVNIDGVALRWQPADPMVQGHQVSRLNSESSKAADTRRHNLFTICHAGCPILRAFAKGEVFAIRANRLFHPCISANIRGRPSPLNPSCSKPNETNGDYRPSLREKIEISATPLFVMVYITKEVSYDRPVA